MKSISDLIKELEQIKEDEGDLDVLVRYDGFNPDPDIQLLITNDPGIKVLVIR